MIVLISTWDFGTKGLLNIILNVPQVQPYLHIDSREKFTLEKVFQYKTNA